MMRTANANRRLPRPLGWHWDAKNPLIHPKNGRKACRWCKGPVVPPKSSFCGPDCVLQWKMRTQPTVFREVVFERDRGICACCRLGTVSLDPVWVETQIRLRRNWYRTAPDLRSKFKTLPPMGPNGEPISFEHMLCLLVEAHTWYEANNVQLGEPPWQVDHINELADGGDPFDLANIQTLCVPDHRRKSAESIRRRAEARRINKHRKQQER